MAAQPILTMQVTCSGNSPNGEMFMNFMDYTDDPCMYMFTVDQTTRIQTAMANSPYRKFLGTHGLCSTPTLTVAFASPSIACAGVAVTMTNNTTGSPTPLYTWVVTPTTGVTFNPNQNATNPSITFNNGGTYTITLTASNGTVGTATQTISITQLFITSTQTNVSCYGGNNGSATANVTGGTPAYSYTWAPIGGNASTATGLTAGVYTVNVKDANNCTSSKTVNIAQPAPINTSISVSGGTLTAVQSGGVYQWVDCNNNYSPISGATSQSYVVPGNRSYAVIISMSSCSDTSACQVITSINAFVMQSNSINIFPNPSNGKFVIKGLSFNTQIKIYDAVGKLVFETYTNKDSEELNLAHVEEGVYFIQVFSATDVLQRKILIKKN